MSEPTVGDILRAAEAAAPGSIRVGGYVVTYQGKFDFSYPLATSEGQQGEEQP
jgi:hypothetical protein